MVLEEQFLLWIQSASSPLLDFLMQGLSEIGNPVLWLFVAALLYWKGKEMESFFLTNLIVFSSAIVGFMKFGFAVPRPNETIQGLRVLSSAPTSYSFPSGHSATIGAIFGYFKGILAKKWVVLIGVIALIVAFSRLYLGMHFFFDVAVGLFIGYIIGKMNFWIRKKYRGHKFKLTGLEEEAGFIVTIIFSIIILIFFSNLTILSIVLGYYFGFFIVKEKRWDFKEIGIKEWIPKSLIGIIILGAIAFLALKSGNTSIETLLFFIGGVWISLIYPYLYAKIKKQHF